MTVRSELCVPLRVGDEMVGVINAESADRNAFSREDLHMLSTVAGHVGTALEKLRLVEEAQRRSAELEALRTMSLELAAQLELSEVLQEIVKRSTELLKAQSGALYLLRPDDRLELAVGHNLNPDFAASRLEVGEGIPGRVAATGEPMVVDDYRTWDAQPSLSAKEAAVAVIAVPVRWRNRVLGVIKVGDPVGDRRFDQSDERLLQAFAQQAAVAIENARLFKAAEERVAELRALHQVSISLTTSLDLVVVLDTILEGALRLLPDAGDTHIFLYQENQDQLTFGAARWAEGLEGDPITEPRSGGFTHTVARQGEPIVVSNVRTHSLFADAYPDWEGAIIGLPLKIGQRVVGVMNVAYPAPHRFTKSEERTLRLLGDQAAVAIENARLHKEVQQRAEQSTALLDIAKAASSALDMTELLRQITLRTAQSCGVNRCTVFLVSSSGDRLEPIMSQFADGHPDWELWHRFRTTGSEPVDAVPLFREIIDQRRSVMLEDADESDMVPFRWTEPFGIEKLLAVPLISHDRTIGVMLLDHDDPAGRFNQEQVDLATTIASQVAANIEKARLLEAEQRARRHAEALQEIAAVLSSTLELDELLNRVLKELEKLVPYDSASIQLLRDGQLEIIAGRGFADPDEVIGLIFPLDGDNPNKHVVSQKQPVLIQDAYAAYDDFRKEPHAHIRSWLGAPLLHKDQAIGMITLDRCQVNAFTEEETTISLTFANHVAIAIENARLYEATRRQAVTDGLTGLYNIRYFYDELEAELERSRRYDRPCSLVMLDLDNFKSYNDRYGHLAGDDLLRELAGLISDEIRQTDTAARYGGEEFMIILPETDGERALALAERLWRTIRDHEFVVRESQEIGRITASVGVATFPDQANNVEGLVHAADMALLQAKQHKDEVRVALEANLP